MKEILNIFLEKLPSGIELEEIKHHISEIEGVLDVHHIHIWTLDGQTNYATMHIVSKGDNHTVKHLVREELKEHGISHVTLNVHIAVFLHKVKNLCLCLQYTVSVD